MKIQIWLIDHDKIEKSELLGEDVDASALTDFYFKLEHLIGFWIDPDRDSGGKDIIFYVGGDSFRTPYKKSVAEQFYKAIE